MKKTKIANPYDKTNPHRGIRIKPASKTPTAAPTKSAVYKLESVFFTSSFFMDFAHNGKKPPIKKEGYNKQSHATKRRIPLNPAKPLSHNAFSPHNIKNKISDARVK